MGPTPGQPDGDDDGPESRPSDPAVPFPDLDAYVDLVSELEEILRSAAAEDSGPTAGVTPVAAESDPDAGAPEPAAAPHSPGDDPPRREIVAAPAPPRSVPLRARARSASPAVAEPPVIEPDDPDDPPPLRSGFWQVEDAAWAAAPAWREPRRTRKIDLFLIGGLVVLIAGGGAYSAITFGDDGVAASGEAPVEASRAEAGLGVPFTPIDRTALLREDPTTPIPSLEAAAAGPEVTPLPVIIEPPVEVTQPIFLADAAPAAADPPAAPPADAAQPGATGGPMIPFDPASAETGVPVGIVTTVTTWVNMRAGPDNGEPVVMVVTPDTPVAVRACDYWCSVSVNGRDGYIFRDFLVALP